MFKSLVFVVSLLLMSSQSFAQGEAGYGLWLRDNTKVVLKNIKQRLYPLLTSAERRVLRSIRFRLSPSWNINAYAYMSGRERVVRIDTGYLSSIDQVSLAFVVDNVLGYPGCYEDYVQYLLDGIAANSKMVMQRRRASRGVEGVWGRAQRSRSACNGVTPTEFQRDPDAGDAYAGFVEGGLSFMILHEIAHHVLGHVESASGDITLSQSRTNETEADIWAFEKGLAIRVNPVAGIASWTFLSALDGEDLTRERSSTHPLTLKRFQRMLKVVRDHGQTDEFQKTFGERLDEDIVDELEYAIDEIQGVLEG